MPHPYDPDHLLPLKVNEPLHTFDLCSEVIVSEASRETRNEPEEKRILKFIAFPRISENIS
jgi:hypothetical protein